VLAGSGWLAWQWSARQKATKGSTNAARFSPTGAVQRASRPLQPKTNNPPPTAIRVSTNLVRGARAERPSGVASPPQPDDTSPASTSTAAEPTRAPLTPNAARPVANPLEAQIALARRGISCGSLDGALGSQTRAALKAFQRQQGLEPTGKLDSATRAALTLDVEPFTRFSVTQADLDRIHPVPATWLGKYDETRLDFESILELAAESSQSHPVLIRRLNPDVDWSAVTVGTSLRVPNVQSATPTSRAASIVISLAGKTLDAFDDHGGLLAHFPVSIAQRVEKRPVGDLFVEVTVKDPDYTFDPELFPESAEAREINRKLKIPPGPNNPVGVAWIGLSLPGYGIHGTPKPEDVGRTESHGCFRLANWNAEYLRQIVATGTRVRVEP